MIEKPKGNVGNLMELLEKPKFFLKNYILYLSD